MRSKLLLLLIILSGGCGPFAPVIDDCAVDKSDLSCYRKNVVRGQSNSYRVSPQDAQKKQYICQDPTDAFLSKNYIIQLEEKLAKCDKTLLPKPKVTDCAIDGLSMMLYCSDGVTGKALTWAQAFKFICLSGTDFLQMKQYRTDLLNDIQTCNK